MPLAQASRQRATVHGAGATGGAALTAIPRANVGGHRPTLQPSRTGAGPSSPRSSGAIAGSRGSVTVHDQDRADRRVERYYAPQPVLDDANLPGDLYECVQRLMDQDCPAAEQQRAYKIFQQLLKISPDAPHTWRGPGSPLSHVVKAGRTDLTRMLLRAKASPNLRDNKGVCPLHLASFDGNLEVCRVLMVGRADVDPCDRHGQTPLFFAPTRDICKLLMDRRADLTVLNRKGQSALHLAGRAGLQDVLAWFEARATRGLRDLADYHGKTARCYLQMQGVPSSPRGQAAAAAAPPVTSSVAPSVVVPATSAWKRDGGAASLLARKYGTSHNPPPNSGGQLAGDHMEHHGAVSSSRGRQPRSEYLHGSGAIDEQEEDEDFQEDAEGFGGEMDEQYPVANASNQHADAEPPPVNIDVPLRRRSASGHVALSLGPQQGAEAEHFQMSDGVDTEEEEQEQEEEPVVREGSPLEDMFDGLDRQRHVQSPREVNEAEVLDAAVGIATAVVTTAAHATLEARAVAPVRSEASLVNEYRMEETASEATRRPSLADLGIIDDDDEAEFDQRVAVAEDQDDPSDDEDESDEEDTDDETESESEEDDDRPRTGMLEDELDEVF